MSGIDEKPMKVKENVHIELIGPDGKLKEKRDIHNLITTVGLNHVADRMSDLGEAAMSHMAVGTDDAGLAVGNTVLGAETDRNALTSVTQATNTVVYVGTWAAGDATAALKEAGIFNAAAAGTMLCRSTFAVINKGALDTLVITWTITFA
jgi:hypothetical protein